MALCLGNGVVFLSLKPFGNEVHIAHVQ